MGGIRRFTAAHGEGLLYVVAAVTYVAFGVWQKWVLNWIMGPAWLVAWVWFAPEVAAWWRGRDTGGPGGP